MITTLPLLFLTGSVGPLELLVIFAVVLVLFGPRKLPEIARSIGRMLHELRKASEDFKAQIMTIESSAKAPLAETAKDIPPPEDASPVSQPPTDEDKPHQGTLP